MCQKMSQGPKKVTTEGAKMSEKVSFDHVKAIKPFKLNLVQTLFFTMNKWLGLWQFKIFISNSLMFLIKVKIADIYQLF